MMQLPRLNNKKGHKIKGNYLQNHQVHSKLHYITSITAR